MALPIPGQRPRTAAPATPAEPPPPALTPPPIGANAAPKPPPLVTDQQRFGNNQTTSTFTGAQPNQTATITPPGAGGARTPLVGGGTGGAPPGATTPGSDGSDRPPPLPPGDDGSALGGTPYDAMYKKLLEDHDASWADKESMQNRMGAAMQRFSLANNASMGAGFGGTAMAGYNSAALAGGAQMLQAKTSHDEQKRSLQLAWLDKQLDEKRTQDTRMFDKEMQERGWTHEMDKESGAKNADGTPDVKTNSVTMLRNAQPGPQGALPKEFVGMDGDQLGAYGLVPNSAPPSDRPYYTNRGTDGHITYYYLA